MDCLQTFPVFWAALHHNDLVLKPFLRPSLQLLWLHCAIHAAGPKVHRNILSPAPLNMVASLHSHNTQHTEWECEPRAGDVWLQTWISTADIKKSDLWKTKETEAHYHPPISKHLHPYGKDNWTAIWNISNLSLSIAPCRRKANYSSVLKALIEEFPRYLSF